MTVSRGVVRADRQSALCRARGIRGQADSSGQVGTPDFVKLVVADASALIEYLLQTSRSGLPSIVTQGLDTSLHVPALCDVETASGLKRALRSRLLSEQRSREALQDYLDLPLTRHGHTLLLDRILDLRANLSACDATYVALAERIDASFLTADKALARAVKQLTAVPVETGAA